MIFTFKSRTTGDLIMLEEPAKQILDIIGKEPLSKGIITVEQLEDAIQKLEQAIEEEAELQKEFAQEPDSHSGGGQDVTLKQRAWPFLKMLKACQKAEVEVVWGV